MAEDISSNQPETDAVRAGHIRSPEGEHSEALFLTSSFVFSSAEEAAQRFSGELPGNVYSRFTNPTVRSFQDRLAALEGGEACIATASGMSAVLSLCLALLSQGEHIVCARGVFGSTTMLLKNYLTKLGIETTFVPLTDLQAWRDAINSKTRLLFVETPSNPLMEIADIKALRDLAHEHGALLAVDNAFCTPALQRPLALGADLVVHSATKYLDGQGRCVGGAVVGDAELVGKEVFGFLRTAGPSMSPFNAWVFSRGLETLGIRMRAHCEQALAMAEWLQQQQAVSKVYYPGLAHHPGHALAASQQSGFGGVVSFEVFGGRDAAWQVIDQTRMISITANLGDVKTTITHPGTTTHAKLTDEERAVAGITPGLLRIAVGLESLDDIKQDLQHGLTGLLRAAAC
ncbi:MAG: O-succinylhomoserine sulfhydrylase [Gammaproteobacteria bacterium]|nr:O-succinylhomoserine sulfhydrylase [Gammaproteobacteria bacterium]